MSQKPYGRSRSVGQSDTMLSHREQEQVILAGLVQLGIADGQNNAANREIIARLSREDLRKVFEAGVDRLTRQAVLRAEWMSYVASPNEQRGYAVAPLEPREVSGAEKFFNIVFPPHYKAFLQNLHVWKPVSQVEEERSSGLNVSKWLVPAGASNRHAVNTDDEQGMVRLICSQRYTNWWQPYAAGQEEYDQAMKAEGINSVHTWAVYDSWVYDGIPRELVIKGVWCPAWGNEPVNPVDKMLRIRRIMEEAPRLIRVMGHRYVISADKAPHVTDVVLSVFGMDVQVYGVDFKDYLAHEFKLKPRRNTTEATAAARAQVLKIPFWGVLAAWSLGEFDKFPMIVDGKVKGGPGTPTSDSQSGSVLALLATMPAPPGWPTNQPWPPKAPASRGGAA